MLREARALRVSARSNLLNKPHWDYWRRFLRVCNVQIVIFGALGESREEYIGVRLKSELEILSALAGFIFFGPLTKELGKTRNDVNYAEQVIRSLLGYYGGINGRLEGLLCGPLGGKHMTYTLNVLRKLAPSTATIKRPSIHGILRYMKKMMDLYKSHFLRNHMALWVV